MWQCCAITFNIIHVAIFVAIANDASTINGSLFHILQCSRMSHIEHEPYQETSSGAAVVEVVAATAVKAKRNAKREHLNLKRLKTTQRNMLTMSP